MKCSFALVSNDTEAQYHIFGNKNAITIRCFFFCVLPCILMTEHCPCLFELPSEPWILIIKFAKRTGMEIIGFHIIFPHIAVTLADARFYIDQWLSVCIHRTTKDSARSDSARNTKIKKQFQAIRWYIIGCYFLSSYRPSSNGFSVALFRCGNFRMQTKS